RKEKRDNQKVVSLYFDSLNRLKMDFCFQNVSGMLKNGFQYAGGVLQFFPHAEGYVAATQGTKTDSNGNFVYIFNYVYNYTDHLGNIRLSYTKDPVSGELEIMEETEARGSRTPNKRRSHKTNDSEQNHTAALASFDLEILNFHRLTCPFGL